MRLVSGFVCKADYANSLPSEWHAIFSVYGESLMMCQYRDKSLLSKSTFTE